MLIRRRSVADSACILPSEITPEPVYLSRRQWLQAAAASALLPFTVRSAPTPSTEQLSFSRNAAFSVTATPTAYADITTYNNFYEFGTDKADPAQHSAQFKPKPWRIKVSGAAEVTGTFLLEDLLKTHRLEERIYRMRCVEAWSMVIPWVGLPLKDLLARFKPTANAKYVAFQTVFRPEQMPGQKRSVLSWPYVEGLRIDEAMHPLSLLAVGLYGKSLLNQNGAPLRLVVPWKYGFKGIKSIVAIHFTEQQPSTTWNQMAPKEYGFYANVNPTVDHPRWSQARERRIGSGLFAARQPTLMFNGYAEHVASLYQGMDLKRFF